MAGVLHKKAQLKEIQGKTLAGMVEAGFLMAAADGTLEDAELETVAGVITGFTKGHATPEEIDELLDACAEALETDGYDARLQAVANNLVNKDLRHYGLLTAALVLVSDGEVGDDEVDLYTDMGTALGFSEQESVAIMEEAGDLLKES
jgi:tellurite resistance protein